jgi:hypothetical protein
MKLDTGYPLSFKPLYLFTNPLNYLIIRQTPLPQADQGRAPRDLSPGKSRAQSSISNNSETQREEQSAPIGISLFANISQRSRAIGKLLLCFGYNEATDPLASEPPAQESNQPLLDRITELEQLVEQAQLQASVESDPVQVLPRTSQVHFDRTTTRHPQEANQ